LAIRAVPANNIVFIMTVSPDSPVFFTGGGFPPAGFHSLCGQQDTGPTGQCKKYFHWQAEAVLLTQPAPGGN
jgi:hypothetical protein